MNIPNLSSGKAFVVRQNLQTLQKQAQIKVPGIDVPVEVESKIPDLVQQSAQSLLSEPSTPMGRLRFGKTPTIAGGVKPATGKALGYANDIPVPPTSKIGAAVVRAALQMRGVPYSWGGGGPGGASRGIAQGTNTVGFDCSGLTQYAFAKYGVTIPRVTYDQFRAGTPVPVNAMKPGDLVFFNPGARGPGHVGIFIGNGKFLQAPQTGDVVKISDLSSRSDLAGVRRFG